MRIYLAGIYHGGRSAVNSKSADLMVTSRLDYPHILESYHYVGEDRMTRIMREDGAEIFLDSGAFSAFTQKVTIDIEKYAEYIQTNADIIEVASNLDVIGGEDSEEGSWANQQELERLGAKVLPCHHARDADYWLQKYLDEGYEHFCLGGMVPESTPFLLEWLDRIWDEYLTNPDGTAKVKIHGFGLTTQRLMFRYPWFSVDSTSWVMTSRFGGIYLDVPQSDGSVKDYKIDFSSKSPKQRQDGSWHFNTLKKPEQEMVRERLAELEAARPRLPDDMEEQLEEATGLKQGLYPETLAEMYGWRDYACIEYFRRAMDRGATTFKRKQGGLFG
jgi:hypothetical protein